MFGTLPGLFLVEFGGYWEDEPDNGCDAFLNPATITMVKPFKRDSKDVVTHWILSVVGKEHGFVVLHSELQLVSGLEGAKDAVN